MTSSRSSPRVSVLMPVRGCRDSLPMAVASVLAQTLADWELLVVFDDADPVPDWLTGLGDHRIRVLRNGYTAGRGGARQTGLDAARGEFLAFLDADDWMLPERLASQLAVLEADAELALVAGGMVVLDDQDRPVGLRRVGAGADRVQTAPMVLHGAPTLSASSMMRRDIAVATGYDVARSVGEDADFFARALAGRRFLQQSHPVYCYREFASFSASGLWAGLAADRRRRLARASGIDELARAWALWACKRGLYAAALAVFGRQWVLRRRCRPMSEDDRRVFEAGRAQVRTRLCVLQETVA